MGPYLIFFILVVIASAEPPVGYNYQAPSPAQLYGSPNSGGPESNAQPKEVFRHVYIHTAPDEPEEIRPPKQIPVPPAQKHYKILFIKAPTPPTPTAPVIPAQPQNEEKTLVYVLVKKPEEQPDIVIPTPAPTQPAKPEVYFIKYKAKKETVSGSEGATKDSSSGDNGLGYGSGRPSLPTLGSRGTSFVQSSHGLGSTSSVSVNHGSAASGSSRKPTTKYGPPGY